MTACPPFTVGTVQVQEPAPPNPGRVQSALGVTVASADAAEIFTMLAEDSAST
ncbi:hypothetical protein CEV32_3145 [Brucella rhizosphaerae]|uniref:Uncharacterized protein n=1 Tax=Brucella rhizosphaerae TaxID=571254 RepID=A0A256FV15_9HYPH|nr:hypothetical protein CEV32_3145 [Brucella rhizosphaerae]